MDNVTFYCGILCGRNVKLCKVSTSTQKLLRIIMQKQMNKNKIWKISTETIPTVDNFINSVWGKVCKKDCYLTPFVV